MSPEQAEALIQRKAREVQNYVENVAPNKQAKMILRFINGNFRAQGFQGTYFKKWKPNKKGTRILIKSGRLRAATTATVSGGQVTVRNSMPYADIHNEGFKGKISIQAHTRNKYSKTKVGTGKLTKTGKERRKTVSFKSGEMSVKAHKRRINMPRRQFMPTAKRPSKTFENSIIKMTDKDIQRIMK